MSVAEVSAPSSVNRVWKGLALQTRRPPLTWVEGEVGPWKWNGTWERCHLSSSSPSPPIDMTLNSFTTNDVMDGESPLSCQQTNKKDVNLKAIPREVDGKSKTKLLVGLSTHWEYPFSMEVLVNWRVFMEYMTNGNHFINLILFFNPN